jgi:hypothetical protein
MYWAVDDDDPTCRLTNSECRSKTRFEKDGIDELVESLQLPVNVAGNVEVPDGARWGHASYHPRVAMMLFLHRLRSCQARYGDLAVTYGIAGGRRRAGMLFDFMVAFLVDRWGHVLQNLSMWDEGWYTEFKDAFVARGADARLGICALLDGTHFPVCRPLARFGDLAQRVLFDGHHWVHALGFLVLVFPNGIAGFVAGPYPGNR